MIAALDEAEPRAAAAIEKEDFTAAMAALASLRGPIDAFFDKVTVNDPDAATRERRLALLARFRDAVHRVADFSGSRASAHRRIVEQAVADARIRSSCDSVAVGIDDAVAVAVLDRRGAQAVLLAPFLFAGLRRASRSSASRRSSSSR